MFWIFVQQFHNHHNHPIHDNFQQFNNCEPRRDHICGDHPHHRHHRWIPGDHDDDDDKNDDQTRMAIYL